MWHIDPLCLLVCKQDGCGNNLEFDVERLKDISVEVVTGPTDDGSAPGVIQDLQASFQVLDFLPALYSVCVSVHPADDRCSK